MVPGIGGRDFIYQRVAQPLGLARLLGIPPDEQDDIAELALCGEPASRDDLEAIFGVPELPVTEVTDEALLSFNRPEVRAVGVPGGAASPPRPRSRSSTRQVLPTPD